MERRYMISDASKMIDVESHVLRYWEEELEIEVPRNEMGHRYYTDYYINLFKSIKDLKDQGFLLKAIKMLMPRLSEGKSMEALETLEAIPGAREGVEEEFACKGYASDKNQAEEYELAKRQVSGVSQSGAATLEAASLETSSAGVASNSDKMQQFQMILTNIIVGAMEQNNESLSNDVSTKVSESVIKEMDYLLRLKEEREEERFKKIDELIRNSQKSKKEAVAGGKRGFFRKK